MTNNDAEYESRVTVLQIQILLAIVRDDITEPGQRGILRYARTRAPEGAINDDVLRGVWAGFQRSTPSRRRAALAIMERGFRGLSPEECEAVFRAVVSDIPGFLRWCFPLLAGFRHAVQVEGRVDVRGFLRDMVPGAQYRWLITHILCCRHRAPQGDHVTERDFARSAPLVGIAATLEEFRISDAWIDYHAQRSDTALRREFAESLAAIQHGRTPDWMWGSVDRPGPVPIEHRLFLQATDAVHLWGAVRATPTTRDTGRISNARCMLGSVLMGKLATLGYLEIPQDSPHDVILNREKFRRSTIIITEADRRLSGPPRADEFDEAGGVQERDWVGVIASAGAIGARYDNRRQRSKRQASARPPLQPEIAVAPLLHPRLCGEVEIATNLNLTIEEAAALLTVGLSERPTPVDATTIGARLLHHLTAAGYLTPVGTLDDERLHRTAFMVITEENLPCTNRFVSTASGKTSLPWKARLRGAYQRVLRCRERLEEQHVIVTHRFRIRCAEAAAMLELAARSPFTATEIVASLGTELHGILKEFGYIHPEGDNVSRFHLLTTAFASVADDAPLAEDRYEAIPETERYAAPVTRWLDDLRAIAGRS